MLFKWNECRECNVKYSVSCMAGPLYLAWNQHHRAQMCFCVTLSDPVLSVTHRWELSSFLERLQYPTELPGPWCTEKSWTGQPTTYCPLECFRAAVARASSSSEWSYYTSAWSLKNKRQNCYWTEVEFVRLGYRRVLQETQTQDMLVYQQVILTMSTCLSTLSCCHVIDWLHICINEKSNKWT